MGDCIEKLPHHCGSRRGLQVFQTDDGGFNGFCFSCNTFVGDPYGDKPKGYQPAIKKKTKEEVLAEIREIDKYKTVDLPDRKIKAEYLDYYGVKVAMDVEDGITPTAVYFPYKGEARAYKVRSLKEKKMFAIGNMKDVLPFGWKQALASDDTKLVITEGEFDAVALFQILKEKNKFTEYKDYNPAVISLPNGSSSARATMSQILPLIRGRFKEVVLAFDMDEAGRKAIDEAVAVYPTAKVADLPEKDANECLLKGKAKACANAVLFNAVKPKNTRLVWGEDLHEAAREQAPWGVSWPWKWVTEKTRGIRKGETIYIGAAQKMGKSEVVNALGAHLVKEHKWKILLAKPEEANKKSYKMLAGKVAGRIFHDPKVAFDYAAYDKAGEILDKKVCMVDLYQHLGWSTLKDDIAIAASEGIDAVFIDPITNLTNGMNAADANTKLQEVAQELAAMAKDLNIVIFIFCHLRNPDSGAPHDRGGAVLTSQFAGSRAMGRSCNYMFGLEGNKDPELIEEERNIRNLVLLDDREYGEAGKCRLFWDKNTGLFNEMGE
ncbi:MAG: putative ATP-dependent helicase [Prokaryotic dsDNA virus sp.]|nr:MAG: putative ATP-dependent helicase [Prokaryotic dsDNA virus sp.]|tara:strand:- start:25330 stop:26976 length:1647 start_codon:yes stop_codon:yes gene_type:complete